MATVYKIRKFVIVIVIHVKLLAIVALVFIWDCEFSEKLWQFNPKSFG